ncbi:hypothetical protein EDC96DRAFT_567859 [Choanephora cucurbitarum]|nr:hypothetical protein EDC96DRAFT_567859 [Choanephora cucurbitarum]
MGYHSSQSCLPAVPVLFVQRCTYRLFLGLSKSHSCSTVDLFIFKTVVVTKLAVSANVPDLQDKIACISIVIFAASAPKQALFAGQVFFVSLVFKPAIQGIFPYHYNPK